MKKPNKKIKKARQRQTKTKNEEKKITNLEREIILDEGLDIGKIAAGIKKSKAPVLERRAFQQLEVNIEQQNQRLDKKEDEIKYGSRIDYGESRNNQKTEREISYQNVTEYTNGEGQNRRIQKGEAFDSTMIRAIEKERKDFRGENTNYIPRDEKRGGVLSRVESEYEVKKRKYE